MKAYVNGTKGFIGSHFEKYARDKFELTTDRTTRDVEVIFSIASGSEVSDSLEIPSRFIRNNVDLVIDLLEAARSMPRLKHFIHLSTSEVYGPCRDGEDKMEWSSIVPHSPYAASKAAQEAICTGYWKAFGVPVTIVSTMNVFGENQQPYKFIPMVVRKIMKGESLTIHGNAGRHPERRRYIHADAVADAMMFLAERKYLHPHKESSRCARYNVAGEEEISLLELATQVSNILGKEFDFKVEPPSRPGHAGRYSLDVSKIRRTGWRAPLSFEDSLSQTVRHLAASI